MIKKEYLYKAAQAYMPKGKVYPPGEHPPTQTYYLEDNQSSWLVVKDGTWRYISNQEVILLALLLQVLDD